MKRATFFVSVLALTACQRTVVPDEHLPVPPPSAPAPQAEAPKPPPEPVGFTDVKVAGDLTAFKLTGVKAHRLKIVFIPGMCVHPVGYVQAFQYAAAARGDLVTLQGDVACLGEGDAQRRWSSDLVAMDRRITAAWQAAGLGEPSDLLLVGYSQGAERIERLVARWPEKYTRAILVASPITPEPSAYKKAGAVVFMAGTNDASQGTMQASVARFTRAGIPATYIPLPEARHGGMGVDPEVSMGKALAFIKERDMVKNSADAASHGPALVR